MVSGSLAQLRLFGHLGAISLHSIMPTSTSGLAGEGTWVVGPGGFVARDAVTMGGNMDCFVFKEVCMVGGESRTWCHVPSFFGGRATGKRDRNWFYPLLRDIRHQLLRKRESLQMFWTAGLLDGWLSRCFSPASFSWDMSDWIEYFCNETTRGKRCPPLSRLDTPHTEKLGLERGV